MPRDVGSVSGTPGPEGRSGGVAGTDGSSGNGRQWAAGFSGTDPIHHVSQRQLHHLRFLDEPPKLQQLVRTERGARQFERQSMGRGYLRR